MFQIRCSTALVGFGPREEVDKRPALYSNQRLLSEAIRRYEDIWLPLVAKHGPPVNDSAATDTAGSADVESAT
eukprot:Skav234820  [mRNA]  locus=scaffold69:857542:857760:- [translate_table: standard]